MSGHTVGVEDGADDPQEQTHKGQSNGKRPSSTKSLNTEENEDGSGDDLCLLLALRRRGALGISAQMTDLYNTVDTRSKKRSAGPGNTDRPEDIRSV